MRPVPLLLVALLLAGTGCGPKNVNVSAMNAQGGLAPAAVSLYGLARRREPATLTLSPDTHPEEVLLPMGTWIDVAGTAYFVYVDSEAGPSIAGDIAIEGATVHTIVRANWMPEEGRPIPADERARRGLPEAPAWVAGYGPQPSAGTLWGAWRFLPGMSTRLYSFDCPDDVQVLLSKPAKPWYEVVWVRIQGCDKARCTGTLLNEPDRFPSIHTGDTLAFPVPTDTRQVLEAEPVP